jgi:hypothetical protein
MTSPTEEFFAELERRGHEPLLEKVKSRIRFDVVDGKTSTRWLVAIDRGDIHVSRRNERADTTLRIERALFDRLATGRANAMAEVLRGTIGVEGALEPAILFQRLFPGPPLAKEKQ